LGKIAHTAKTGMDHYRWFEDIILWVGESLFNTNCKYELLARLPCHEAMMPESEIIFVVQESPEGCDVARALRRGISTQAGSVEEQKVMVRDAVRCHFEPEDAPRLIRLHLVNDEVIPRDRTHRHDRGV
jgi:hypothetical protein